MKTQISSKGQLVLPAELREMDGIEPGQQFEVQRLSAGKYLIKKIAVPGKPGLTQWLSECPAQGWFQCIESESTDTV